MAILACSIAWAKRLILHSECGRVTCGAFWVNLVMYRNDCGIEPSISVQISSFDFSQRPSFESSIALLRSYLPKVRVMSPIRPAGVKI